MRGEAAPLDHNTMTDPYNPETKGARMSFDGAMSYTDDLGRDAIPTTQHTLSEV